MALTNTALRNAKPGPKQRKLFDEKGLFVIVTPNGGKWWRFRYRFGGGEKLLSLGTYPEVSLKEARERRDKARKLLAKGINPAEVRQRGKEAETFEEVARELFEKKHPTLSESYARDIESRFDRDIFPYLGHVPVNAIKAPQLLAVLRRIESRGALESAKRALQKCGEVFRYGVATGRCERDPSGDLKGALAPQPKRHFATLTDAKQIAGLLRAIDGYSGQFVTICALRLAPLVFVRPGELRRAEWSEIDFEAAEWRIPAEKMKMKEQHIVPLSRQAMEILQDLYQLTGQGKYVFPSLRSASRPMSENTVNAALRRLGYDKTELTGHGFRAMASTRLNELGWPPDVIERQLAHAERNKVRAAYNHAEHLDKRQKMMQAWADYLDGLRKNTKVVAIGA